MKWIEGFRIHVSADPCSAVISANREGLLSLANHLTALAREAPGSHVHLDEYNSLDGHSAELIIERTE